MAKPGLVPEELRTKFWAEQVLSEKISKEIAFEEGNKERRAVMSTDMAKKGAQRYHSRAAKVVGVLL